MNFIGNLKKIRNNFSIFLKEETNSGSEEIMRRLDTIIIELDQLL